MRTARAFVALLLALVAAVRAEPPRLAIQPLGKVSVEVIAAMQVRLTALYQVDVAVLPPRDLPAFACFRPRARYRAEKLLDWLEQETPAGVDKIIGITQVDISTTKDDIPDWGIFGLGKLGRRPCVVSTFRLGRDVSPEKMLLRTGCVTAHEIGHTFGLPHCPTPHCLMHDAGGKVKEVDESTGKPCPECLKKLGAIGRVG